MRSSVPSSITAPSGGAARIAVGLLDLLATEGQSASRERALQAVGAPEAALRAEGAELPEAALVAALRAVPADAAMARRLGRSLVQSRNLGLWLRYSGVATPEKAYRRCDHLLARENPGDVYESARIAGDGARIVHRRREGVPEPELCAAREGMLQAIPSLFGLPVASVRESACARNGAPSCVFDVRWGHTPRAGLRVGAAVGALAGIAASLAVGLGGLAGFALTFGLATLAGTAGRSFDLVRQIRALAAHQLDALSLVDQADGALAERIDELAKIDSMLDAADGETDSASRHRRPRTDLAAVVRRAAESASASAPASVDIELDLDEDDTTLRGDAFQLEQMVTQLLRNAVQAASQEPEGRVSLALRRGDSGIEIAIHDNGPGIDPDVIDRIFDPFLETPIAGSDAGFGLPVSYRIAQAHGGELRVEGEPGSGTRVTVWLPADLIVNTA